MGDDANTDTAVIWTNRTVMSACARTTAERARSSRSTLPALDFRGWFKPL